MWDDPSTGHDKNTNARAGKFKTFKVASSFGILISELEQRGGKFFFLVAASRWQSAFEMELMIFVIGRGIYGLPFILNMGEKLSPEDDLESSQWALLMSGWWFPPAASPRTSKPQASKCINGWCYEFGNFSAAANFSTNLMAKSFHRMCNHIG